MLVVPARDYLVAILETILYLRLAGLSKKEIMIMDVTELFMYRLIMMRDKGVISGKQQKPNQWEEQIGPNITRVHRSISVEELFDDPSLLEVT